MRYAKITITCDLPIPEDQDIEALDSVINSGVSRIENELHKARALRNIRTEWEIVDGLGINLEGDPDADITMTPGRVPRRYHGDPGLTADERERDRLSTLAAIEADADQGISFVRDVMGQRPEAIHPWEQGLYIFPEGHPLRGIEEEYRSKYRDPRYKAHLKPALIEDFNKAVDR